MARTRGRKPGSSEIVPVRRGHEPALAQPSWPGRAWVRELDRMFEDFDRRFRWPRLSAPQSWWTEPGVRMPALDVYEKDNEIVVMAEIPGMSKDDVQVSLANSTLTISGEKKKEEEIKDEDYYRCERSFGSFSRSIELPAPVKIEEVKASFTDGVLEIHLPKTAETKRKLIKVEVG